MKQVTFLLLFLFQGLTFINAQISCDELKDHVKDEDSGMTYFSYDSDAITKVSFHELTDDSYNTYYFAIVQFTSSYQEYIYQVDSSTKLAYSIDYLSSAGKAFWKHINPYKDVLGCAPTIKQ